MREISYGAPIKNFSEQIFEVQPAPSGETLNAAVGSRLPRSHLERLTVGVPLLIQIKARPGHVAVKMLLVGAADYGRAEVPVRVKGQRKCRRQAHNS
jgi:hypothetical protein